MFMFPLTCVLLLFLGPLVEAPQQQPPDTAARFSRSVKKLGSDDYQEREAGSAEILALPAEALGLVESELKKPNLDAEVRKRLERCVPMLRAKGWGDIAPKQLLEPSATWTGKTVVDAYDRVGRKDPRWDAKAKAGLALAARSWEGLATVTQQREAYALCAAAMDAGCDDPMVLYARARMVGTLERKTPGEELRLHLDAATAMKAKGSRYHPLRQSYCFARAAESLARSKKTLGDDDQQQIQGWHDLALARFKEGIDDSEVPDRQIQELSELLTLAGMTQTGDRAAAFAKIDDALVKARPTSALPLTLKGDAYTSYAWDARGSGYADTVTEEGWRLMRERLAVAEAALTEAWKRDSRDGRTATLMIRVEMGKGKDRDAMETWYKRAMAADPNNLAAVQQKMLYLEPKWHGNADAMLKFGRELLAGGNWGARLPIELVYAHMRLAAYREKPEAYYQEDHVWEDVQAVYEQALKRDPDSAMDRSYYARLACFCGQWKEAKAQFDALGGRAEPRAFADASEYRRLKLLADTKAK
jgi:hypothetical protein